MAFPDRTQRARTPTLRILTFQYPDLTHHKFLGKAKFIFLLVTLLPYAIFEIMCTLLIFSFHFVTHFP